MKGLAGAAVALAVAVFNVGWAAAQTVSAPVNVTNSQFSGDEESLGVSPDGSTLAGAWVDFHYNNGCGFSYSTDGGASWAPESFVPGLTTFTNDPSVPGLNATLTGADDPSVVFNPKFGDFDVVCQATKLSASPKGIQLLATTFNPSKVTAPSDTNGSYGLAAWRLPDSVVATGISNGTLKGSFGQFPDHDAIAVDTHPSSPYYGRVYVGWAQFNGNRHAPIEIAYSDDDGATWTGPIIVSNSNDHSDQDARPSVAPNGDVFMTWLDSSNQTSVALANMSHDGGATWGKDSTVAPIPGAYSGLPNSLYRDFTDVWSTTDSTGRLVVAYGDESTGVRQIWTTHALQRDSIAGFAAPFRVDPTNEVQFFPWLSAAPTSGRVDLIFYDRSCDPLADTLNCVTESSTTDGGATWSTVPVTTTGFDGDTFQTCTEIMQPLTCGLHFLGDYVAIASTDTTAQMLWTANGPQAEDVFSAHVSFP